MKILHVISGMDPRDGGPAFALSGLGPALVKAGIQTTVLATYRDGDDRTMCEHLCEQGVVARCVGPVSGPLARHPDLRRVVNEEVGKADVVHIHSIWEEIQHSAARAAFGLGKPYIIRPCGMLDPWSLSQSRWKKKAMLKFRVKKNLNRAAALHFTADLEHKLTRQLNLTPRAIIEPNGINTKGLVDEVPPEKTLSAQYPELSGRLVVLFLSRLHHKKGPDILLKAFARVVNDWNAQSQGPAPGLVIAGPDEAGTRAGLEALVDNLGLNGNIVFTGLVVGEQKAGALQSADLFCLPSHQENFGIVVVEALAAGTPVIISDQVNIHEAISEAGVGQAIPLNSEDLADALRQWLSEPAKREAAAKKASVWACRQYSWKTIAQRWAKIHYTRLLDQKA